MTLFGRRPPGSRPRTSVRSPALHAAKVASAATERSVVARDVSTDGARLYGAQLPMEGTRVEVTIGPVQAKGQVVWQAGSDCGIEFASLVAAEEVSQVARRTD